MDRNQGNRRPGDTSGRGPQSGTDSRNLGNMDDEAARRARREADETTSRDQGREEPQDEGTPSQDEGGSNP